MVKFKSKYNILGYGLDNIEWENMVFFSLGGVEGRRLGLGKKFIYKNIN